MFGGLNPVLAMGKLLRIINPDGSPVISQFAKGDLLIVKDSVTLQRLPADSDAKVLTLDSSQPTGCKWAAAAGGASEAPPALSATAIYKIITAQTDYNTTNGGSGFTLSGTVHTFTVSGQSAVLDADGTWIALSTGTTLNTGAYLEDIGNSHHLTNLNLAPRYWQVIKTDASAGLSNTRIFLGLADNYFTGSDPGVGGINALGFRYSTDVDGTAFWRTVTSDASASTVTTTTTAISASSVYVLAIDCRTAGSVLFYINGTLVATHTTHLPAVTTGMSYMNTIYNLDAANKVVNLGTMILETK